MADRGSPPEDVAGFWPRPGRLHMWEYAYLLLLLAFVAGACWPWMTHLGLNSDEAYTLPAAVKIVVGSPEREPFPSGLYFLHRPIPFVTAAYVGAFDAYLYSLVFSVFGISVLAFRITNLVLSLTFLGLTYVLARNLAGRPAAVLASLLLALDLEFLLHAPTNFGPILAQLLCALLSVLLLQQWLAGGPQWRLWLAAFFLGLGFTEKLTFVLFAVSLAVSLACFYGKPMLARLTFRSALMAALAFALGCLPVLIYSLGNPQIVLGYGQASTSSGAPWPAVLAERYEQFRTLVTGQFTVALQGPLPPGLGRFSALWWGTWLALLWVVAGVTVGLWKPSLRLRLPLRACAFLLSLCAGVLLLSTFFRESGRVHHLMLVYPFVHCAVAIAAASAVTLAGRWSRALRYLVFVVLGVPLLATGASTFGNLWWYNREVLRTGGVGTWSSGISELAEWVKRQPEHHFVFLSWGLYRPVFTLSEGTCSCREYYFPLVASEFAPAARDEARRLLGRRASIFVISHALPDGKLAKDRAFALAGELGLRPRLLRQFYDSRQHTLLYEAYGMAAPADVSWSPATLDGLRPVELSMREFSVSGSSPIVLRSRSDEPYRLGLELPLPSPRDYVRFRVTGSSWSRFNGLTIELVAPDGEAVRRWDRPFLWYPMIRSGVAIEVGPDLYPDYFLVEEKSTGQPDRLRIFVGVKGGSGAVDLAISDIETGLVNRAAASPNL